MTTLYVWAAFVVLLWAWVLYQGSGLEGVAPKMIGAALTVYSLIAAVIAHFVMKFW